MEWETPLFTNGEFDVTENLKIRTEGGGGKIREIIVDGEVVGRFRSSGNDCVWFDRPKPEPEPEQMAFFECDYSWNSIGWQKLRCGPMTMAEAKALSKQIGIANAFCRNSRIVPAAPPSSLWGVQWDSGQSPQRVTLQWDSEQSPQRVTWWYKSEDAARDAYSRFSAKPRYYPNLVLIEPTP